MKKTVLALTLSLAFLAIVFCAIVVSNVWYAEHHPPVAAPGTVEQGRMALHAQLLQAGQREEQFEKLYWNSPEQLQVLIQSHQQRIDRLAGNAAGGEIVAHDQDAIARLQQRIADLATQAQAQTAEQAQQPATTPDRSRPQ
jgi:hypothetical protein